MSRSCPPRAECIARLAKLQQAKDAMLMGEQVVSVKYADWAATFRATDANTDARLTAEMDRLRRCLGTGSRRSVGIGFR